MIQSDWKLLRYFGPAENWGDPQRMDLNHLLMLDKLRAKLGTRMIVTCGTQGKHVENSLHGLGLATDIVFPELRPENLLDVFIEASRLPFGGIGLYPFWKHANVIRGGIHLDSRKGDRAYWIGVHGIQGQEQTYVALNSTNILKYGLS